MPQPWTTAASNQIIELCKSIYPMDPSSAQITTILESVSIGATKQDPFLVSTFNSLHNALKDLELEDSPAKKDVLLKRISSGIETTRKEFLEILCKQRCAQCAAGVALLTGNYRTHHAGQSRLVCTAFEVRESFSETGEITL